MKTLYLDIFSGISGDMMIGALIDLGVDARALERELTKLGVGGYHLHVSRALEVRHRRAPSLTSTWPTGTRTRTTRARAPHRITHDDHRNFAEIQRLIGKSRLSSWVKGKAVAVFERIAEAEGKIHGMPADKVHFHEVGAVDSIIDIVGACIALEMLGKPSVLSAPVVEGVGWVDCAHGRFPVPRPPRLRSWARAESG